MIEIYFNDTLLDLPDDETVYLNKSAVEIGDVSARKSDFSREIKVKRTREMEALFENAGLINSQTDIPYKENSILYISNGLEVIRNGKAAFLRCDDSYYYINIYEGKKSVFDEIAKLTLNDLDLSDLEHTWNFEVQADSIRNDEDYQYLLFDPSDDGGLISNTPVSPPGFIFLAELARPFIKLKRIWDQIWTDQGITCTSDIDSNALFLKMLQPISKTETTPAVIQNYLLTYKTNSMSCPYNVKKELDLYKVYDPKDNGFYRARLTGLHKFLFILNSTVDWELSCTINSVDTPITPDSVYVGYYYFTLDLTAFDIVVFYVKNITGSTITLKDDIVQCYSIENAVIGYGSTVNPELYLDSMKQSDFIKAVCNFFCLVPSYNSLDNTLHFWSLNNILKNRIIAKDWSIYLSLDDTELIYSIEKYQQKNWIKYKESDDVLKGNGDYYLICNNKSLESEQDLIELPISFTDEVTHQSNTMSRIAWYESIEGSADYNEQNKIDTRWVTSEDCSLDIAYQHGLFQEVVDSTQAKMARSINNSIGANIQVYDAVQKMITSPKVLTVKMNLPSKEVQNIDHSIPIFLEQFSEYFYLNNVSNWADGYLCDVELIRI